MWFDDWHDIGRVLSVGTAGYVTLVLLLRVSGKRTLAKLNAFDLVVTIALGSMLAALMVNDSVSYTSGIVGLWLLIVLQFSVAAFTVRFPWLRPTLTARPSVILRDGVARVSAMRRQRVTMDELRQAVRSAGVGDLNSVAAVVLESDGSLSVIPARRAGDLSALHDIRDLDEEPPASPVTFPGAVTTQR